MMNKFMEANGSRKLLFFYQQPIKEDKTAGACFDNSGVIICSMAGKYR